MSRNNWIICLLLLLVLIVVSGAGPTLVFLAWLAFDEAKEYVSADASLFGWVAVGAAGIWLVLQEIEDHL
jgi:hypothetical protein